jgi:hypothetical protein
MKFGSRLSHLHFLGKDVIATRIGSHILFHDLSTHTDTIYTANNHTSGDGISCVAGHQNTAVFAFGEKCPNPRIFVKKYPSFSTVSVLKGVVLHYEILFYVEKQPVPHFLSCLLLGSFQLYA